ncbi:hypothetical protein V8G54_003517 [Vigna mungo]|uniref:Retrotransposon gag domain-containing protein n=1 Tax=Vigna mungo TaxID=3915 RepID=A0AAQ3PB23_VIGMU
MQRKHEEEIAILRNERARRVQSEQSHHTNLNGNTNSNGNLNGNPNDNRGRREPTPLQTIRLTGLLPFTATIMWAPMPEKASPTFDKYDISTDPDYHMRAFVNAMEFYFNNDPVLCRAFSLSLKGEELSWYNTLPPNTMDCFATVQTLFGRQYASSRVQELTAAKLVNTRQERDESLKAFMKRYNETARRVKDVNHTFIISNLPSCLKAGYFSKSLYARLPKNMDELQERVTEFIHIEDIRQSRKEQ